MKRRFVVTSKGFFIKLRYLPGTRERPEPEIAILVGPFPTLDTAWHSDASGRPVYRA